MHPNLYISSFPTFSACLNLDYQNLLLLSSLAIPMAGSSTSATGSSKGYRNVENFDNLDRISNLPERLLSQILSLLPTKEAVATSILSKRWIFLWTTITAIDIFFYGKRSSKTSIEFAMNRLLLQRTFPPIRKFTLGVSDFIDDSLLDKWFSALGRHQVKHIKLYTGIFFEDFYLMMPCKSLFHCKNLEVLILSGPGVFFGIQKEESICFPALKVLHLEYLQCVQISTGGSFCCFIVLNTLYLWHVNCFGNDGTVNKLLRECPVLEFLHIKLSNSIERNSSSIQICSLSLRKFELDIPCDHDADVEIDAPVLQYVTFVGLIKELKFKQIPYSLVEAKILVGARNSWLADEDHVLFKMTPLFKYITVDCVKYQPIVNAIIGSTNLDHPLFCNLNRLEVSLWCEDMSYLQCFLRRSVNLRYLIIQKVPCGFRKSEPGKCGYEESDLPASGTEELGWNEFLPVPTCLISSLKGFEIFCFYGCPKEVAMIKYILENSKVLEKVIFYVRIKDKYGDKKSELLQKISSFPRGSAVCKVEVRVVKVPSYTSLTSCLEGLEGLEI